MADLSDDKLQKELDAQRKRVEARKFLNQQNIHQHQEHDPYSKEVKEKTRIDNTLDLLFKEKASSLASKEVEKNAKAALLKQQEDCRASTTEESAEEGVTASLPAGWEAVFDPASKKEYYWNNKTNETTWDRPEAAGSEDVAPSSSSSIGGKTSSTISEQCPAGWVVKVHPATQQKYWENVETKEKRFTAPGVDDNVHRNLVDSSSSASNSSSSSALNKRKQEHSSHEQSKKRSVDPLDPTGGKGDGNRFADGKMADSTASGPLWQQRPYPAPGKALLNKAKAVTKGIGPITFGKKR